MNFPTESLYKSSLVMPAVLISLLSISFPGLARTADYDLVIRGGRVLDGSGNPWVHADVAIDDGRFVKIGTVSGRGEREIDARGKYVSPGWIDMLDQSQDALLQNGDAVNKVLMGVTSAIGGEGGTPVPAGEISAYFSTLEKQGISINFGCYYNVFQAHKEVIGEMDVAVKPVDIRHMQALVRQAMEEGAMGMSSATFYPPHSFISTQELVAMAQAIAPYGGIYAAHIRDESRHLLTSIQEVITVGEEAGIPVEIFHFKNAFQPHWDTETHKAIELIEEARARGVEIAADQYPYIAAGTSIVATIPTWVFAEGLEAAIEKLRDPAVRVRLKQEILNPKSDRMVINAGGWDNIILASPKNETYQRFIGKSFTKIGQALGKDPADAAWDIGLAALPNIAYALYFVMSEPDVKTIMKQPWLSIGSDSGASVGSGESEPHPRAYGTFPRIIAKYVREDRVLSLEDAIRKMTSWPATRMKLQGRGLIVPGYWADVVIFDYDTIQDNATWKQPTLTPSGIDLVLVNGVVVAENGQYTGKRPGKVLYGPGRKERATDTLANKLLPES